MNKEDETGAKKRNLEQGHRAKWLRHWGPSSMRTENPRIAFFWQTIEEKRRELRNRDYG